MDSIFNETDGDDSGDGGMSESEGDHSEAYFDEGADSLSDRNGDQSDCEEYFHGCKIYDESSSERKSKTA